eukprot:7973437-Pyramimonas_sp.AAC.1
MSVAYYRCVQTLKELGTNSPVIPGYRKTKGGKNAAVRKKLPLTWTLVNPEILEGLYTLYITLTKTACCLCVVWACVTGAPESALADDGEEARVRVHD